MEDDELYHVFAMPWITFDHLGSRFEALLSYFRNLESKKGTV